MIDQRPIAAIDIGSNSVFLMIVRPETNGFVLLHRDKWTARLGEAVARDGAFSDALIDRCCEVIARFSAAITRWEAEVIAVATAAVRRAANGAALIASIAERTGIAPEVIDGFEEGRLAYEGARAAHAAAGATMLCVDLGGGSTELARGDGPSPDQVLSAPMGAVTLTSTLFPDERVSAGQLRAGRAYIRALVHEHFAPLRGVGGLCVATAGTITRIARLLSPAIVVGEESGAVITGEGLQAVVASLTGCTDHQARRSLPGMDPSRADVLLAGALAYLELLEFLGIHAYVVSVHGLRAGLVSRVIRRRKDASVAD